MIAQLHDRIIGAGSYTALALIRLFLGVHMAVKGLFAWHYQDYLFGAESFAQPVAMGYLADYDGLIRAFHAPIGLLHIVAAMLMAAGLGGRWSILVAFVTLEFSQSLNIFVLNGGDSLTRYLLLYLALGACGTQFSLVSRPPPAAGSFAEGFSRMAVLCVVMHLSLAYVVSGLAKIASSEMWQNGTAIYYILHQERFMGTAFGGEIVKVPWITTLATYGVLGFEIYFPCLILVPRLKLAATLTGIALHGSIALFMMIYDFQLVFLYAYLALWSDEDLGRLAQRARRVKMIAPLLAWHTNRAVTVDCDQGGKA